MSELELIKKIEAYLLQEMNEEELFAFEQFKKENPAVEEKIAEHAAFVKSLKSFGETKALKAEMARIHQEMLGDDFQAIKTPSKVIALWDKYKRNLAVAASVAILTTLVTLYSTGQFQTNTQTPTYNALKRDMENIKKSQNALIRNVNSQGSRKEATPSQFGGTGFALSADGYLVTNYHVVEGPDSIYVQNN